MDLSALFTISYGLYALAAKGEDGKDNACIINTVMQLTSTPCTLAICVNKQNYTHDLIQNSREFNLSVLSKDVTFAQIQKLGFVSGRDGQKDLSAFSRAYNGIVYLTEGACALLLCKVSQTVDCITHTLFIATVEDAVRENGEPTTYEYYRTTIKPAPPANQQKGLALQSVWLYL